MPAIHITVGSYDDLNSLVQWLEKHKTVVWPTPKNAKVGDQVLLLIPAFVGDIVASGTIKNAPLPSEHWASKYASKIGRILLRENPIPIDFVRDRLPEWKYLSYARGYTTVPEQHQNVIEAMLHVDRALDIETGVSPDEVGAAYYWEGATHQVIVNAYERSPGARRQCIKHYGSRCFICGFDFAKIYGPSADGLIHVHHLTPLSEIPEGYEVDPIADLRPVCPNCHAVIHHNSPPFTVEEVEKFLGR